VPSFIAYAVVASNSTGNPWYLILLLVLAIITGGIATAFGIRYWVYRNRVEVGLNDSEAKSKVSTEGDNYVFDIAFTLKAQRSSIDIARVLLHTQDGKAILKSTKVPFKLDHNIQSHVSTFESSKNDTLYHSLQNEGEYYLSVLALGKENKSKVFKIDHSSMTIVVPYPSAPLKVPKKILGKFKKLIADKEGSQD